jgi:hypothetical protein
VHEGHQSRDAANACGEDRKTLSAKSVRNLSALLGMVWVQAKADGYTQIDPFIGLGAAGTGVD